MNGERLFRSRSGDNNFRDLLDALPRVFIEFLLTEAEVIGNWVAMKPNGIFTEELPKG
jgi:hypothetical protein